MNLLLVLDANVVETQTDPSCSVVYAYFTVINLFRRWIPVNSSFNIHQRHRFRTTRSFSITSNNESKAVTLLLLIELSHLTI